MFNNELWQKPTAAGATGFYTHQIANSMRFAGVQDLDRSRSSAGSTTTSSISFWIKRSKLGAYQYILHAYADGNNYVRMTFLADDTLEFQGEVGGAMKFELETTQVFRDTSAWYHIVGILDFTNGTQGNRAQLYVNGERVTAFDTETYPADASQTNVLCGANTIRYGDDSANNYTLHSSLAEIVLIDGTAQAVGDFGETKNGAWIPKDPSGLTFGTTGHYLKFTNSSALGEDFSGNDNDFTPYESTAAHDQMLDSPTFGSEGSANFPLWSPLFKGAQNLSEANTRFDCSAGGKGSMTSWAIATGTKFYIECLVEHVTGFNIVFGIANPQFDVSSYDESDATMNGILFRANSGSSWDTCSLTNGSRGSFGSNVGTTAGRVLAMTVNRVDNEIKMYLDNSLKHTISISATEEYHIVCTTDGGDNAAVHMNINAGHDSTGAGDFSAGSATDENGYGSFQHAPPSGFLALCTANLPTADAVDPAQTDDDYPQKLFSPLLYTGNGSTNNITGLGFQPDLTYIKIRNTASNGPLVDSTRGTNKVIFSQINGAQVTSANLTAFGSDGFSLDGTSDYLANFNGNTNTYVGWNWRANGGSTSSGSGDLTSTHQVDPSGGFSIVKAVGDGSGSGDKTVTHGMSAAPDCILAKNLDSGFNWDTYWSSGLTATSYSIRLNTSDNQLSGRWGTVNSSIFTCKYNYTWVGSDNFIYYCFRNIEGYIKVGTYTGNANNDGVFVYTGFRPAWMLLREVAVDNWGIYDNKRVGYNLDSAGNAVLYADYHGAEENQASRAIDILSNGFKLRTSNATFNASGTYVFLAMAHNPFQYALGR